MSDINMQIIQSEKSGLRFRFYFIGRGGPVGLSLDSQLDGPGSIPALVG